MKSKKGLSLLVLTITIMVMILLASIVVFTAANTTNNSKKAAFASDLEQIESLVREYYLANGVLPIVTGGTEYTKTTFTNLIADGKSSLESEISENGDDSAAFYKIDLSKLDIESTKRGLEEDGDTTDAYFLASGTFNVYYLRGEEIADEYYFSLSEKLTGKSKVANNPTLDTSSITVSSATGAIRLTKSTAEFTNTLTVDVKVTLEAGETMKYTIAGQEITVASGATTIDVANIISSNSTLQTAFYQSENNKYLLAQKYSSGNVIAEVKINIANLDILSGSMTSVTIAYSKYNKFTLAKISGYTDLGGSGVKEARVVYTTKQSGEAYYTNLPTTITKEYVKQAGKSFNKDTLKLPIDVASFALVFIDNAGNVSDVTKYETANLMENAKAALKAGLKIGDVVIGYVLDSSKTSYLTSGKENTAPNGQEVDITTTDTRQTILPVQYLTWRYIGIGKDGDILIAPDTLRDYQSGMITLSGKGGYLYGTTELNDLCEELYSTDKGTARSINIEDIHRILEYTGPKGSYNDNGNEITTDEPIKISNIGNLNNNLTPDGKNIGGYYADYYMINKNSINILKSETAEARKTELKNLVYAFADYFIASTCTRVIWGESNATVQFGIRGASESVVEFNYLYTSSENGTTSTACGSRFRPVVSLKSTVQLTKLSNGSWQIN